MLRKGIVRKSTGSWYDVIDLEGNAFRAVMKGKLRLGGSKNTNPIAVGDGVEFQLEDKTGTAIIEKILPRRNYIIRKANNLSRQEHVIAANLDMVLILATLVLPRTSQGFIDRVLVTAEAYEIPALIVYNKIDFHNEELEEAMQESCAMYQKVGYTCMGISATKQLNIDALRDMLQGKTTLITGHSGVGKSSLMNVLDPELSVKTSGISAFSLKGKHTTTFAEMHVIAPGTFVIDTPGIKEFGIIDINREELSHFFPEMCAFLGQCRFNNCMHVFEPGCKVLEAVEEGKIDASRYASYLSMLANEDSYK